MAFPRPSPDTAPPPLGPETARWIWPGLAVVAMSAMGLVAAMIDEILEGGSFRFDAELLLALRRAGHRDVPVGPQWLEQSAIDLSALGGFTLQWLLGGGACLFLIYIRRRAEALWLAGSIIGASLANTCLKSLLHRPRPELVAHLAAVSNTSFPSGHAMISAAVYLTIGAMLAETQPRRLARIFLMSFAAILVPLIGCSRVYLGVHWPSDVLAGWLLGAVWALIVFAANRMVRRKMFAAAGAPRRRAFPDGAPDQGPGGLNTFDSSPSPRSR